MNKPQPSNRKCTVATITDAADDIEFTWTEWADEDVIEAAEAAVEALRALANTIQNRK
jgi:hypothetical protein